MTKEDMILLLEVQDELKRMDRVLEKLTGFGHAEGEFTKLDNVYNVIQHNAHHYYSDNPSEEVDQLFYLIVENVAMTPEERAEIILNGTMKLIGDYE